ncbi:MAG: cyclic nucleotide-binding domain-containing protein [Acidimicrobiia bacterium]|nr:cyclic nucleotide-binding domain-containing protein [Acidimicrobiia bacterium]
MADQKLETVRQVPLFRACSPKELEYLARLSDEITVSPGRVLAEQGKPGHEFFMIVDGKATVRLPDGDIQLGKGDFFGEMALLDNEPRVATVVAETAMELLVLGSREFSSALAEVPTIARSIMAVLAQRLRAVETGATH